MAGSDPQMLWITKGSKCPSKDQDFLDPYALYDFFDAANTARTRQGKPHVRAKSAAPRTGNRYPEKRAEGWVSPLSVNSLRNPTPSPATSRPVSSRSGRSLCSSKATHNFSSSPTSLYLASQRSRCKSAPPRPLGVLPPQRPKTAKQRQGSAVRATRNAPKRAWQIRTNSAKTHHALLSPEEVQKRHQVRCKSAPLPYDFSSIELVAKIPEKASDVERMQAMIRPLACMPEVVKNVLSHNGIRHCCSAYNTRPKTAPDTRQQFWPVSRPSVFHRGNVPKYLHFVQPIHPGSRTPTIRTSVYESPSEIGDDALYSMERTDASVCGSDGVDLDETVLYEEQFAVPMTPTEPSVSEHWEPSDEEESPDRRVNVISSEDLMRRYLEDVSNHEGEVETLFEDHEPLEEKRNLETGTMDQDHIVEVVITKTGQNLPEPEEPSELGGDSVKLTEDGGELGGVADELPVEEEVPSERETGGETEAANGPDISEDGAKGEEPPLILEPEVAPRSEGPLEPLPVEVPPKVPVEVQSEENKPGVEKQHVPEDSARVPTKSEASGSKPQTNQVTFADSIVLTSYKAPESKADSKEPVKPILKPSTQTPVVADSPVMQADPPKLELPKKKVKPILDRREADLRPQTKENQPWAMKVKHEDEEKHEEDKKEEAKEEEEKKEEKKEPPKIVEVLPKPKYVPARGAYKMYQAQDLLQYYQEQSRDKRLSPRKSIPVMPHIPWSPESTVIVNTVLGEEKRKKEGLKPWLQGRLALSKQTSRFELPMDVRLLEAMTPMEYLMKYCIISTRRKALYKHVFQKVDRDRDSNITFKEFDKGLKEIHVDLINTQQVLKIAEMVEVDEKSNFNLKQFSAIAAFSERLLFSDFATPETSSKTHNCKEIIEEADFSGLKWKLNGFNINPTVKKILETL